MPGCPFPTGYFKIGESKIPAPCKQWTCPHCGPIKKNKLLDRITTGATIRSVQDGGYRLRFMTLPLSPTVNEYLSLTQAWAQFRANAWKSGYRIRHYFWTRERTKAGAWHMHVCINVFVPWQRIQHWWRLATGCYVTDISAADAGTPIRRMAAYMAKYISKNLDMANFPKGMHRYGFSRDVAWKVIPWNQGLKPEQEKSRITFEYNPHQDSNWWEYWRLIHWQNSKYEKFISGRYNYYLQ
jgi:hypothetical protein